MRCEPGRRSPDLDHEIRDGIRHFLEPVRHAFRDDDDIAWGEMVRLATGERAAATLVRRGMPSACERAAAR